MQGSLLDNLPIVQQSALEPWSAAEAIEAGLGGFLEEGLPTGIFQRGSLSPSRPVDPNSRDTARQLLAANGAQWNRWRSLLCGCRMFESNQPATRKRQASCPPVPE